MIGRVLNKTRIMMTRSVAGRVFSLSTGLRSAVQGKACWGSNWSYYKERAGVGVRTVRNAMLKREAGINISLW